MTEKKNLKKNWLRSNFKLLAFFMRGISTTTYLLFQCKKREKNFNFTKKMFFIEKIVEATPFFKDFFSIPEPFVSICSGV